jgi:hypothetical protein
MVSRICSSSLAARSTQHDCNANGIPDACDPEDCELVIREVVNFTNWW